jgi:hypothetical protein
VKELYKENYKPLKKIRRLDDGKICHAHRLVELT